MVFVAPIMQTSSNLSHFRKYPQHISVLKHFISDFGQTSLRHIFLHSGTCLSLFFFFCMWTTFKVFIEFVKYCFYFTFWFFWPWGMQDLSSLTRDRTHTPIIGRQSLNQWTSREVLGTHLNEADRIFATFSFPGPITTLKWVSLVFCSTWSWSRCLNYVTTRSKVTM